MTTTMTGRAGGGGGMMMTEGSPTQSTAELTIRGTEIEDTFAEAFPMTAARLVVTAVSERWVLAAAHATTGYASSVIGCDAEAGVERFLSPAETPDGRPGVSILLFAFSRDSLQKSAVNRVGQCVLTCPTTACYNGLPVNEKKIRIGGNLRFFGDGWQASKLLEGRRYWRMPVMDGEFLCEDAFGTVKGVAGGNLLILAESQAAALSAAEAATEAIGKIPGVILPFPGGVVRSGSKVGSKYKGLRASTNDAYCPTLRGVVTTALPPGVNAVYELVFDGVDLESVAEATRVGVRAACGPGVRRISAGNYGGKLGPHHFKLHELLGPGERGA
jgi:formylmethanofuran--tetrahydromethanopterin N-formyltransferase